MSVVATHTTTFRTKVDGAELPEQHAVSLIGLEVDQRLNLPAMLVATFADPEQSFLDDAGVKLGSEIDVQAINPEHSTGAMLFSGEVVALEIEFDQALGSVAVIRGFARSHRLTRGRRSRTFLDKTVSDIIKEVLGEHGISHEVPATHVTHPWVMQHDQSDWEFLLELATEAGLVLYDDEKKVRVTEPPEASSAPPASDTDQVTQPTQLVMRENVWQLHAVASSTDQPDRIEVLGWDPKEDKVLSGTSGDPARGLDIGGGDPKTFIRNGLGSRKPEWTAHGSGYAQQSEVDAMAKAAAQELRAAGVEVQGTCYGDPALRVGEAVSIGGCASLFKGGYALTAVRHLYDPEDDYRTEFVVSGPHDRTLRGMVDGSVSSGRGGSPPLGGDGLEGVCRATVTNLEDPEDLGRIKVVLPWDAEESIETDWAYVTQLLAGKEHGALFTPEVGDEVLVAFDRGDLRRPYVVGALYSGQRKPEKQTSGFVKSGKAVQQRLETRRNQRLVFFDDDGRKEGITLRTGDDKVFLDLNRTDTEVVLSSDGTVKIAAKQGDLTIDGGQNIKIKATQNLELEGGANVNIKSNGMVELKATGNLKAEASGITEVKGSMVKIN